MQRGDKAITPFVQFTAIKSFIESYPSPVEGMSAIATDTNQLGFYSGGSWQWGSVVTNHNDLIGIQGGGTDEYYHLTAAQYAALGAGSIEPLQRIAML